MIAPALAYTGKESKCDVDLTPLMHRRVKAFLRPPHSAAAGMVESFAQSLFGGISANSSDGKVRICHSGEYTNGTVMTAMLASKEACLA